MMKTTLCWKCNKEYSIEDKHCPRCFCTNANINPEKARLQKIWEDEYTDYTMRQGELGNPDRSR